MYCEINVVTLVQVKSSNDKIKYSVEKHKCMVEILIYMH